MLDELIIKRTLRVPALTGPVADDATGRSAAVARQMDAVLLTAGFTASPELLAHIAALEPGVAMDRAVLVIGAARELVGDHVAHVPYFAHFPHDVPDTVAFWLECLRRAVLRVAGDSAHGMARHLVPSDAELVDLLRSGLVGLTDLPDYGRPQHTHEQMLALHERFVGAAGDRVTVLRLGQDSDTEALALYTALASSTTPLHDADRAALELLAAVCVHAEPPSPIPVRENRAIVNAARLAAGAELLGVDTVTDVLRLACQLSDGDVTLGRPTRLRTLRRAERRALMAALDRVVAADPARLGDVAQHYRMWQRLGHQLHPGERNRSGKLAYAAFPHAREVFAVASGSTRVRSAAGRVEIALREGDVTAAVTELARTPGALVRRLDHLLRTTPGRADLVLGALAQRAERVSGRVLCSVREHLDNRLAPDTARVFVNRRRKAWIGPDLRTPLPVEVVSQALAVIDDALLSRLPVTPVLVVDPAVLDLAVPLSGAATQDGFGVLPRGSRSPVHGEVLRMFCHWRQRKATTDFDLTLLMVDDEFDYVDHVSWTGLHSATILGATHSGDIVTARDGATEFIDVPLAEFASRMDRRVRHLVPAVYVYGSDSEDFQQVAESMFGWMTRSYAQQGAPFEAASVRMRSDMRGPGRVALPVAFTLDDDGRWTATWLHLYLPGRRGVNMLEGGHGRVAQLGAAVMARRHLTVGQLVELMASKAGTVAHWTPQARFDEPVTYIGLDDPGDLPDGSRVITTADLNLLVPQ